MHILVTGAAGFVGRHTCRIVTAQGHSITAVVRQPSSSLIEAHRQFLLPDPPRDTDWDRVLPGHEAIIHLAGRAHIMTEDKAAAERLYREANVELLDGVTRAALRHGVRRLVYVSSIKVNGEETFARPYTAADEPAPEDMYGRSKLEAEQRLRALAGDKLEWVILRPPLMYGPGVRGNMQRLFKLAAAGLPMPFGSIRNVRDLLYVGSFAELILKAVEHPEARNRTFLARDGAGISTADLYRKIAGALGKRARMLPFPVSLLKAAGQLTGRADEVARLTGNLEIDDSETRRILGWTPTTSMDAALKLTADWFKAL